MNDMLTALSFSAAEAMRTPPANFVVHLRQLVLARPDEVWLTVVGSGDERPGEKTITYAAFAQRVRALAAVLQRQLEKGARALVMLDNDDHYAVSMLACFHAGVIAVPVFPPESNRPQHLERLVGIALDSQAGAVLTSLAVMRLLDGREGPFADMAIIAADEVDEAMAQAWIPCEPVDEDIAFLQYTSGSTSAPKGVMVTHGNLMANERAIQIGMGVRTDDRFVSWSPLYHDMGLIGGLLQPLYSGVPLVLTSPRYFLESPFRWLELISRHRASVSGGPDFAYRLCLERVKDAQLRQLDLSSWRMAYTGAEPVRADTEIEFCERFAQAGFHPDAVYACYGLAEATLFVSGGQREAGMVARVFSPQGLADGLGQPSDEGTTLVGCGVAAQGHEVRIVEPASMATMAPGLIGEIWARGPSVGAGYWGKARETQETFVMHDGHRWLRTGDLGFVLDGQLFVTGRMKDVIIVRGHNIYPQDIERLIENEVEAVRKGRVAAFSVAGQASEGIGVAVEVSRGMQKLVAPLALVEALGATVSEVFGEPLSVVVLLNPGALPKTSSGKLQRQACRKGWSERSLDAYAVFEHGGFVVGGGAATGEAQADALQGEFESAVAAIWARALRWPADRAVPRQTHFFLGGGNSIAATQAASHIAERWNIEFPPRAVFEHPRLNDCAAEVRRRVDAGLARSHSAIEVLHAARRSEGTVLSHAQQRFWFLWQLDPADTAPHVGQAWLLEGPFDAEAMARAVADVVARHEVLRTVFQEDESGTVVQRARPDASVGLRRLDLSHVDPAGREAALNRFSLDFQKEPFDLRQGPLLRVALARLAEGQNALFIVAHHVAVDGASLQVLGEELGALYGQHAGGQAARLGVPAWQYADYAAWERTALAGDVADRQLAYWRQQLGSEHAPLALPLDHPRRGGQGSHAAAIHTILLSEALVGRLREASATEGGTVFMALAAALQALLHRYSGQADIRLGVPVDCRPSAAAAHGLVGLFVNTVVLRSLVDGRMSLRQLLAQARDGLLAAHAHKDLPFDRLVEALQPERSLGHTPLFQVLFNQVPDGTAVLGDIPGLVVRGQTLAAASTPFELSVEVCERQHGEVSVSLIHAKDLFDHVTIDRLGRHFQLMLEALASAPDAAIGDVLLRGADGQAPELARSSRPPLPASRTIRRVHEVIALRAAEEPQRLALTVGYAQWTRAALEARANQLAHRLLSLGVARESRVGIALGRGADMLIALLAVLKSGATYVPIDPALPADRVAYMLEDGGVALLLCDEVLPHAPEWPGHMRVLRLDTLDLRGESEGDPGVDVHAEQLAYVMYTSGSTGRPKGVMVTHAALSNFLESMADEPGLGEHDVLVASTSLSFDIAGLELYLPLMVGARLVLASRDEARDGVALAGLLERSAATVLQATPAGWRLLLAGGWKGAQGAFKGLCGGEALQSELARELIARGVQLWNMYGPTETTVWSSTTLVDPDCLSLGGPIAATQLHVLDAEFQPVPPGVAGELCIGGEGLARGYRGRPGLSAERFVADPHGARGERLYRTGDLVRWRNDGALVYLGRLDHQVKVRGFRIELGEVESVLLGQPGVDAAVVVALRDPAGDRLVGYVTPQEGHALHDTRLREALAASLPDYMVPASIVVMDAFPLNHSGKVDRLALPRPTLVGGGEHEPPHGPAEHLLARVWSTVLGREGIGRHDNFFALGGDSILSLKLVSLAAAQGLALSPRQVFENQSLQAMAAVSRVSTPGTAIRRLDAVERADGVTLSNAQRRQWFFWQMEPASSAYHISGTLHFTGAMDHHAVERSVAALVARHESMRTVFEARGESDVVQVVRPAMAVEVPLVDLRGLRPDEEAARLRQALQAIHEAPFDLGRGPLLRVALIRLAQDRHALAVVVHHIVADGWSMQIIVDEFAAGYQAVVQGREWAPAALPIQYADYAVWQGQWLAEGEAARQLAWWRAHLGGENPVLELPTDHPRQASRGYRVRRTEQLLPSQTTSRLRELAREHGATLFGVLLSAFQVLLRLHTRQSDLRIGIPVTNRGRPETEGLVGFFVNAQVLRTEVDERLPLKDVLRRVRDAMQGGQANQDLPFEQLVEAIQPGRDLSHSPLFRIVMNHQKVDHSALAQLPGLRFDGLVLGEQAAQFELALDTVERPDGDVVVRFGHAVELFEAETIERLSRHYLRVVRAFAESPDLAVGDIDLLDAPELARLVDLGHPSLGKPGTGSALHTLIEAQAERHPGHAALVDGDVETSYAALDRQANQLAHALISAGLVPEGRVGLAMERSSSLVVAVLAILKAGGCYVPLDPDYPADRLQYMVADSGVEMLITHSSLQDRLPSMPGVRTLCVDEPWLADQPAGSPERPVGWDSLAYIIYTSGSTGRPKGVQVTHRNVARLLSSTQEWFHFGAQDVWTLFHSYAFDFSVWEIFGALCHGGTLVVVPFAVSRAPDEFARLLSARRVTVLNQTPSAFRQLMQVPGIYQGERLALRAVIFGGEALEPEDLKPWMSHFGDEQPRLINMYGITETTVHVTYRRITASDLGRQRSPIGGAIPDLGLYVLNEQLGPVPPGVPGELYVSGEGLARGYFQRPGLTSERFVANPFDPAGGRLYRTGDLARRTDKGEIEYLGRIDQQVKVRGYRIELGEIESRLRERGDIQDAAVVVREVAGGDQRLAAYLVPDAQGLKAAHRGHAGGVHGAMVEQWEAVFDSAYAGQGQAPSFRGWDSSYTDQPIPVAEMQEWLDETVRRIEGLQPRRVLEVGCGVGLLVERLAPRCDSYHATDLSPRAVADLRQWVAGQPQLAHVVLRQRQAVDFGGIEAGGFDTMVLNSVAQYFPDVDYFVEVLTQAARVVGPQGHLFVGDLRHLAHLPLFHASIQLGKAEDATPVPQILARVERALSQEKELVIDPALFAPLAAHLGLGGARILLKRGCFDNELTRYRYDVVLGGARHEAGLPAGEQLPWDTCANEGLEEVRRRLAGRPAALSLRGVPNRRLSRDLATWALLREAPAHATAASVRAGLDAMATQGFDPEDFWRLGDSLGYAVAVSWTPGETDGRFDVDFAWPSCVQASSGYVPDGAMAPELPSGWRALATDPLLLTLMRDLGASLREDLMEQLPAHMVPSSYTMLDALPLTPTGKLDRAALPEPDGAPQKAHEAPVGATERVLASLWAELLGLERVGRTENFFELGGHSLLATQLISRVRTALRRELPLRAVFQKPVLQAMASHLDQECAPVARAAGRSSIAPVSRSAHMPLSPIQRRLWVVDRLADPSRPGERSAYNMTVALRLSGTLDVDALRDGLSELMRRHEVLRTVYPENDEGEPVAVIHGPSEVGIAMGDISLLPVVEQVEHVQRTLAGHADRVFDLAVGPVLRGELLRLGEGQHVLLLCVHHIAFDGWSTSVFTRELAQAYQARAEGRQATLAPLAVQYADYAAWHERVLAEGLAEKTAFWRGYLEGIPGNSTLPPGGGQDGASANTAAIATGLVPRPVADAVAMLARREGTSVFTVLLSAFLLTLHKSIGTDDLVVGTDVAGREHAELEGLIGFFVNVVPLRSRWHGGLRFTQWLALVKDSVLSAFEHQDMPFDQIVDAVGGVRGQRRPLVKMLFVLQNAPAGRFELPGLSVEVLPQPVSHSKFDLAVFVREEPQGLVAEWVYAAGLYPHEPVKRLCDTWLEVVARTAAMPEQILDTLAVAPFKEPSMDTRSTHSAPSITNNKLDKLMSLGKASPAVSPTSVVRTSFLDGERTFPIVIEPAQAGIDVAAWARENRDFIETLLRKHAGILFRGFGLETPQDFERFAEGVEPELHGSYGDLPKKEGGRNTYRSTPYPERQMILYHNESSHTDRWPRKQWFFCELPSPVGGATPIVDCREMLRRLPPDVVDAFERKELLYVRTFTPGLDVSWQHFFKTDQRAEVEARLALAGIAWRWLDEETLQTRTRCPAVITHPVTGERVFFNQVQLHHISCLEPELREDLLDMVGLEHMPRNVYYGDGSTIDDETMDIVGKAYEACAVRFKWRQGDVVMLDNMLAAHARDPFEGPRKIVVAMGAMYDRAALEAGGHEAGEAPADLQSQGG